MKTKHLFGLVAAVTVAGFTNSSEFRRNQAKSLYSGAAAGVVAAPNLLHRALSPSAAELSSWAGSALSLLSIEAAFLSSDEFSHAG